MNGGARHWARGLTLIDEVADGQQESAVASVQDDINATLDLRQVERQLIEQIYYPDGTLENPEVSCSTT